MYRVYTTHIFFSFSTMASTAKAGSGPGGCTGDETPIHASMDSSSDWARSGTSVSASPSGSSGESSDDESAGPGGFMGVNDVFRQYDAKISSMVFAAFNNSKGKPVAKAKGKGKSPARGGGAKKQCSGKSPQKKARKSHGTIFSGKQSLWKAHSGGP